MTDKAVFWMVVVLIVGSLLSTAVFLWGLKRLSYPQRANEARWAQIRAEGAPGTAQITQVEDSGGRLGNLLYLLIWLDLQVQPEDGSPAFPVRMKVPVSPVFVARLTPGATLRVRIAPDRQSVAIDEPLE